MKKEVFLMKSSTEKGLTYTTSAAADFEEALDV